MERARTVRICLTLTCLSCDHADLQLTQKAWRCGDGRRCECSFLECSHAEVCRFGYEDRKNQVDDILNRRMDELESDPFWAKLQAERQDQQIKLIF